MKIKIYEGGKQYNTKVNLWEAIKTTMLETEPAEVKKKITKSFDNRLLVVIEKMGLYVKMQRIQRLIT